MSDERNNLPSASKLGLYLACPASYWRGRVAEASGEVMPAGEDADRGTRIHAMLESCDFTKPITSKEWPDADDSELDLANACREQALGLMEAATSGNSPENRYCHKYIERRIWLLGTGEATTGEVTISSAWSVFSGKADLIFWVGAGEGQIKECTVVDYKTGIEPVSPDSPQMQALAILAADYFEIPIIKMVIIQPLRGEPQIATMEPKKEQVRGLADFAKGLIENPYAKPVSGDHCKFCPARGLTCHEPIRQGVASIDAIHPQTLDWRSPEGRKYAMLQLSARALNLPNQTLANCLNRLGVYEKAVDALKWAAKKRIEDGENIPGWEAKRTRGRREIPNAQKAVNLLAAEGLTIDEIMPAVTLSPSALDALLVAKAGKRQNGRNELSAKRAKIRLGEILRDEIAVGEGSVKLVRSNAEDGEDGEEGE